MSATSPFPPSCVETDELLAMLDQIGLAIMLLGADGRLRYVSYTAQEALARGDGLTCLGNELRASRLQDVPTWNQAWRDTAQRRLRRVVVLGDMALYRTVALVPVGSASVMVMIGRPNFSDDLAVQVFARAHGLSLAEEQVLRGLSEGLAPGDIAKRQGVKIATVRTQIAVARAKTSASSIRDLLQRLACMPPLAPGLRPARSAQPAVPS